MKNTYLTTILLFFPFLIVTAQNSTLAAGGDASGDGGSSSFSIGQIFYERPVGNGFSTIQGLQQPIEIVALSNDSFENNPQIKIYPNPAYSGFYILLPKQNSDNAKYILADLNGRIVHKGDISTNETFVNTEGLTAGVYMLQVFDSGKVNGYKIIKQ